MGIIKRPDLVKLQDADTPVEDVVCVVIIEDDPIEEVQAEIKPKAVITSSATGEQFGTWVPSLRSSGNIDINVRNAFYTKVGQLVTCTFDIVVTNMMGGKKDSSIVITGLPVSSIGPRDTMSGSAHISYFKTSNLDVRQISGTIQGNDNRIDLWCEKRGPGGLTPLTQLDININTVLVGTVIYITNS